MSKILTLIGVKFAKKKRKFLFSGSSAECESCNSSLKSVCIGNLEKGCIYEILEIRDVTHPCPVHGEVAVVEVCKAPIKTAVEVKFAYVEGATFYFKFPECDEVSCPNYKYCKPMGVIKEDKYKILKIFGDLPNDCEKGRKLKLIEMGTE